MPKSPIDINKFKNISGYGEGLASVRIDTKKTKGDDIVLKSFGGGKSRVGKSLRQSTGPLSKLYSLIKDPSGKANRSMRQEFMRSFNAAFPNHKLDIDGLVDVQSTKPLNLRLVKRMIDEAEVGVSQTRGLSLNGNVSIDHSTMKDAESVKMSFNRFVGNAGFDEDGCTLLRMMDNPYQTMAEIDDGFHNLDDRSQEFAIARQFSKMGAQDLSNIGSPLNAPKIDWTEGDFTQIELSFREMMKAVPDSVFMASKQFDVPDLLDNGNLFVDLKNLVGQMMDRVGKGNADGVADKGKAVLEKTEQMVKAVSRMIDMMLMPEVVEAYRNYAKEKGEDGAYKLEGNENQRLNKAVNIYDQLLYGLQRFRSEMSKPEGTFQGIIALGLVAASDPKLATDRLREQTGQEPIVWKGPEELIANTIALNDPEVGTEINGVTEEIQLTPGEWTEPVEIKENTLDPSELEDKKN